ncbi:hypothetical protein V6N13_065637 [Hibiscus sabdariffa]
MDFMNQGRNPRPAQSYGSGRYWVKGAYDHVKVKKVDFGKTGAVKRKAGIIYRNQRPLSRAIEETEENSADKTMEPEKSGGQAEKGETMVYGGSKARVKRSCKGKMKFTGIYGSRVSARKMETWNLFSRLNEQSNLPWLVGRDFNEILDREEKEGG